VPKLWSETIEAHRRAVRDATLETTAALVAEHGLASVTMSQIAEETGIGRATLYKYFSDVESILVAWHERQVNRHMDHLEKVRDEVEDPEQRVRVALETYAMLAHHQRHSSELAAMLHHGPHVARAQRRLTNFLRDLIADAARAGEVRSDVSPEELASFCLHALNAAGSLPSKAAVRRLVSVTVAGLREDA
jgi:AcrR family transcriptional regulator